MTKRISGQARGHLDDAAEQWLKANDPAYSKSKRGWQVPSSDMLARALDETNEAHPTLEDLREIPSTEGDGNYQRRVPPNEETTDHE